MIKRIRVKNLKIGEVIATDVIYRDRTRPLVVKNSVVTPYVKERLEELEIMNVEIYSKKKSQKELQRIEQERKKKVFKKKYKEDVSSVKDVFNDIVKGEKINLNKIDHVSQSLVQNAGDIITTVESIDEIKQMDEYTYEHSINVSLYAMMLAKWLNLSDGEIKSVVKSGILHDIGKGKLDQDILNKPGKLTDEEFDHIKQHPVLGYEICKPMIFLSDEIKNGILMHHEKLDGSGYPLGIKDNQIPFYARIIAICDIYDALTAKRVYKAKQTPFDTFNQMIEIGKGQLDEDMLGIFLKNIVSIYIDSEVRMSNGQRGQIIHIPEKNISKPIIKIEDNFYDLSKSELKIEEML